MVLAFVINIIEYGIGHIVFRIYPGFASAELKNGGSPWIFLFGRYVDTFNQGGGNQANLFQSPSVPSIKPAVNGNPKFLVPTPVSSVEERIDDTPANLQDVSSNNESTSSSNISDTFQSSAPPSLPTRQRFGSMGHIPSRAIASSRRTASWSGSFDVNSGTLDQTEVKPLGDMLGMSPPGYMPNDYSLHSSTSAGSFGDDLHEVEL